MAATLWKCHTSTDHIRTMKRTATSTRVAGDMFKLEDTVVIATEAIAIAAIGSLCYKSAWQTVPCAVVASGAYLQGSKVYFDAADEEVNESSSGNTLCGIILTTPATGAEEVEIDFDGTLGIVA
jgi:hypothetical protein